MRTIDPREVDKYLSLSLRSILRTLLLRYYENEYNFTKRNIGKTVSSFSTIYLLICTYFWEIVLGNLKRVIGNVVMLTLRGHSLVL